jgi:hypothetical protein
MLSTGDIVSIVVKIKGPEKARRACNDSGVQKQIEAWIEELKKRLSAK